MMERFAKLGISPQQVMGAGAPGGSRTGGSLIGGSRTGGSLTGAKEEPKEGPEFVNTMVRAVMEVRENFDEDPDATVSNLATLKEQFPDNSAVLSTVSEYYNELQKFDEAEETASDSDKIKS